MTILISVQLRNCGHNFLEWFVTKIFFFNSKNFFQFFFVQKNSTTKSSFQIIFGPTLIFFNKKKLNLVAKTPEM